MPATFTAAQVLARLPHRHPMALIDGIYDLEYGTSARGVKNVTISDPVFAGHFPTEPIYPGVMMIEAAAQVCGLILSDVSDGEQVVHGYLASVKKFRFLHLVRPGDRLDIFARSTVSFGGLTEFAVELRVGTRTVASGALAIALAKQSA